MAWRPHAYLLEGELDNTVPNKVTGWLRFAGMKEKVTLDLVGDFHRDIRGAKVNLRGEGRADDPEAERYMEGFAVEQTGEVGDMTAGLPPADYTNYPYLEWFGSENGRIVLELESSQVEAIGRPIPACESDPVSRQAQDAKMTRFLAGIAEDLGLPGRLHSQDHDLLRQHRRWLDAGPVHQVAQEAARRCRHSVQPAFERTDCRILAVLFSFIRGRFSGREFSHELARAIRFCFTS